MPILSIRALLSRNLSGSIDPRVVDGLLTSYEKLIARFRKGELDGSLSEAGKFVAHVLRPGARRVVKPRLAQAMIYGIRSKRGATLVKEIDPKQIDAALSAQAASWVL